ncbi:MAG: PAS domain-containing protein [Polyangiales bacterium]
MNTKPTEDSHFRALAESLPQLIWTCRGDGPCDYLSPQWVAFTGVPEQEQLGYAWLQQLHPDDRERVQREWAATAPSGQPFDIEFRIRRHDGVHRWFKTRAQPVLAADGSVRRWIGSNTDIQDLRDAENVLRDAHRALEARYHERNEALAAATLASQRMTAQLVAAQRVAQVGSWQLDVATNRVSWSEQLFRTVGLEPAEQAPDYPEHARLFAPESWRRLVPALEHAVQTGEGYELELEVWRPDGTKRICVARAETTLGADGKVTTLTGTFHDVTDLKEAQLALEKVTERNLLATAAARIGVWDWDVPTNVLSWDPMMMALYGVTPETFSGSYAAWRERVHPDDLDAVETDLREAMAGRPAFEGSFRVRDAATGAVRHLRASALVHRGPDGAPVRVIGVNWEITAQREAEQARTAQEQLLQEFVTHAPAAIAMFDRDMRHLQVSEQWFAAFGLARQNLLGRSLHEVIPDLPTRWQDIFRRVLDGAVERCDEDPFPRAGGGLEWLQWEARPWHTAGGDVGGLLLFVEVITARKRLELAFEEQRQALARSNEELQQFAYIASHDLQEPLRAVSGCSQMLRRRYQGRLDAEADELIQHVVDGSARMHALIRDLLAYSRIERGTTELAQTPAEGAMTLALANLKAAVAETGAEVTHDALPEVRADARQLAQLLQNLLGNAIKYHGADAPRIHVGAVRQGSAWEFRVRDNGIGIDPKYRERIFVPFQRLHVRTEYPGTGIGLAICKKIVQRHGGRIWVEPAPDRGSVFCFTLPDSPSKDP